MGSRSAGLIALGILVTAGAVAFPSLAQADVIQPDEVACENKQAGDECEFQDEWGSEGDPMMGSCQCATCSEPDFSDTTPPTYKDVPCLVCMTGVAPGSTSACGAGSDSSGGSTSTGQSTSTGTPLSKPSSGCSGCSVGGTSWWSFGLGLGLLGLLRLRRARPGTRGPCAPS